jgi:hypothetical protein
MPAAIASWLSEQEEVFPDITFLTEYPPRSKATPLRHPIAAVGLERVKITDLFVENEFGELVRDEYCRSAEIEIRFSVYVPYSAGGTACHEAFTRIIDCLSFHSDLNITESRCENVCADRDTEAFMLRSFVLIKAEFCPAETSEVQYEAFLPKTFFCASHIEDTDLHVTPEDKQRWDRPLVTGRYFGTGSGARSIDLGFEPASVMIFAAGVPPFALNSSQAQTSCAYGAGSYASPGLTLTGSGFTAENVTSGQTEVTLNARGVTYCYAATRNPG